MRKFVKMLLLAMVFSGPGISSVWAAVCAGVEARVNVRTARLQSAVLAQIAARTTALVAQEQIERQRLLSALHVLTKQIGTSNSQEIVAEQAASKAFAQVIVEQSVSDQLRNAVERYGNTGYNACGIVTAANDVAAAQADYDAGRSALSNAVSRRHSLRTQEEFRAAFSDWADRMQNSDDITAEDLFNGDMNRAEAYMDMIMGPPRSPAGGDEDQLAYRLDRVEALKSEARSSVSGLVMSDVANSERVDAALQKVVSQWVGEDGGEAWAARQAASGERAVLLDTARLEAANLAIAANAYKRASLEEFALATFALTYVDRMLKGGAQ